MRFGVAWPELVLGVFALVEMQALDLKDPSLGPAPLMVLLQLIGESVPSVPSGGNFVAKNDGVSA